MNTKGFDANQKISYKTAVKFKQSGFEFVVRYVGRYTMAKHDITADELNDILRSGLSLCIVQHCPGGDGILPSSLLGKEWGATAREFSKQVGYKKDKIVYLDLEDINPGYIKNQQKIYDYCNAWYEEVAKDFTPGIYIGFNNYMTSEQLYYKLRFKDYWRSLSRVPEVAIRGYAMNQYGYGTLHGIQIDRNELTGDKMGRFPPFMQGNTIEPTEFDKALDVLAEEGITNNKEYWRTKALEVKYLDQLIINIKKYIERRK